MKTLILLIISTALFAQTGPQAPKSGTYTNRPSSPATGTIYIVTDDSAAGACAGGGSAASLCRWTGSAWAALGDGNTGSGGVPYTGATGDVDLGTHKLIASGFDAPSGTAFSASGTCVNPSTIATPASGDSTIFYDSTNACHLSRKNSAGAVVDEEAAGSGMTYPGAGVPNSTGSAWGTSYAIAAAATANAIAQRNSSGEVIAANTVATGKTPMATDTAVADAQMAAKYKTRVCEIHIWGSGTSQVLQDADDEPASCYNGFGVTETITAVRCWTNAGSPTVTPIITDGSGAILTGALTCTNTSTAPMGAAGTLSGTPTLASTGTINANVTTVGGTATNIRIYITLAR